MVPPALFFPHRKEPTMSFRPPPKLTSGKHFTAFHSAAEEAVAASERESWDNEGGHTDPLRGRVVRTPGARFPYKAVLSHAGHADSARAFDSIREAEAFIRRNTPAPAPRSTLYDRAAGDS
jgi:hypothetical protein